MKVSEKSIIDTICRNLLNEHDVLVMLTKDGEAIDRSVTIAASGATTNEGFLDLPLSDGMSIGEVESEWKTILGFDVSFIAPQEVNDEPIGAAANSYFMKPGAGSELRISPKTHFSRFRRDFRELTGLGIEIHTSDGSLLDPKQPLSAAGAKAGKLTIHPEKPCSELVDQLESVGLMAKLYSLKSADDRGRAMDSLASFTDESSSELTAQNHSGCFSLLEETLDSLSLAHPEFPSFSPASPFPIFHRILEERESFVALVEKGGGERKNIEKAMDSCINQASDREQLWKADTLLAMLESELELYLDLSKERDEIISDISSSWDDLESAKESLKETVEEANQTDDLLESSLIDRFLALFCFAANKAIEENDEEILEEWIVGFGYGSFWSTSDEESVLDIMDDLEMNHREEVVPAFMSLMKYNFGADLTPDGELRDETGDADYTAAVSHIVESCF